MDISVTNHAIKRYRQRMFDYVSPEHVIAGRLKEIYRRGHHKCIKSDDKSSVFEIKYQGISIIILADHQKVTALTCLGEDKLRRWMRTQNFRRPIASRLQPIKFSWDAEGVPSDTVAKI